MSVFILAVVVCFLPRGVESEVKLYAAQAQESGVKPSRVTGVPAALYQGQADQEKAGKEEVVGRKHSHKLTHDIRLSQITDTESVSDKNNFF